MAPGKVILVGAGPGDAGLITVRGREVLRAADVVVYDRLANPALLAECRGDAVLVYAGKGAGGMKQAEINQALVEYARQGHVVCRLKGGDPFLFGRGGEEASYLVENGIAFEVVPGVTSAVAVPAYAGIPVTDRRLASTVAIASGHPAEGAEDAHPKWQELNGAETLVVLMGVGALRELTTQLLAAGRRADDPAAVIERGATAQQRTVVGTLGDIAQAAETAGIAAPAILVVGPVVNLRQTLAWVESKPLWGMRVLVTRPAGQAEPLAATLREAGAEVIECPYVEARPLPTDAAALRLLESAYEWILFVSANGASAAAALRAAGRDVRAFPAGRIGAVGPATAAAVEAAGLRVDFVPTRYTVADLGAELPGPLQGKLVLLPGRAEVNPRLQRVLADRGAELRVWPVYETVTPQPRVPLRELAEAGIDVVTLTSPSAAQGFVALGGQEAAGDAAVACIGPPTAQAARDLGLAVAVVAETHTADGLAQAVIKFAQGRRV